MTTWTPWPASGVEVAGEGGDEGFAFAGLHFGDFAGVEDHAADELDVEVAHADGAAAGLANDGEGFGHEGVEGGLFGGVDGVEATGTASWGRRWPCAGIGDACAELEGFVAELVVGEGFDGGLEGVDLGDDGEQALDGALVGGAEDFGDGFVDHGRGPCGGARGTRVEGEAYTEASAALAQLQIEAGPSEGARRGENR